MKYMIGLVFVAGLLLSGCGAGGTGSNTGTGGSQTISSNEIQSEYAKSKDEAKKKYDGKELTILSKVAYRSTSRPSLKLGGAQPEIECFFEENDPQFKSVAVDQTIKVKGTVKFTDSVIEIKPCKIAPL